MNLAFDHKLGWRRWRLARVRNNFTPANLLRAFRGIDETILRSVPSRDIDGLLGACIDSWCSQFRPYDWNLRVGFMCLSRERPDRGEHLGAVFLLVQINLNLSSRTRV